MHLEYGIWAKWNGGWSSVKWLLNQGVGVVLRFVTVAGWGGRRSLLRLVPACEKVGISLLTDLK